MFKFEENYCDDGTASTRNFEYVKRGGIWNNNLNCCIEDDGSIFVVTDSESCIKRGGVWNSINLTCQRIKSYQDDKGIIETAPTKNICLERNGTWKI